SGPDGRYGLYNQYLVNRVFPDTWTSTADMATAVMDLHSACELGTECGEGCYGRGRWENLGPFNAHGGSSNHVGVATRLEKSPYDADIMYAGSIAGGMFKTINGAESWTPIEIIGEAGYAAGTIGVSDMLIWHKPDTDEDIVVASTGYNWHRVPFAQIKGASMYGLGVVKSLNGGMSWQKTAVTHNFVEGLYVKRMVKNIDEYSGVAFSIVVQEKQGQETKNFIY